MCKKNIHTYILELAYSLMGTYIFSSLTLFRNKYYALLSSFPFTSASYLITHTTFNSNKHAPAID